VLDIDSSVSPTYGAQEGTAYNGHFECTCYHPLFVFNQDGDLERCAQLLDKASADFDWAVVFSAKRLADELEDPESGILVLERDGDVQAMVRYRCVTAYGRQPVRGAAIELWADDGLTGGQRARLLGHVCSHLREHGVHVVQALRCAMMPASAFMANLFLPTAHVHLAALLTRPELAPAPPKTWSLVLT